MIGKYLIFSLRFLPKSTETIFISPFPRFGEMMSCLRLFILLNLLIITSCSDSIIYGVDVYEPGLCIEEVNKMYYAGYVKNKIYRVDQRSGPDYFLSMYQNKKWLDIRARHVTYFKNSKNFEYAPIQCPGTKKVDRGLAGKIKRIEGVKAKHE